MQKPIHWGILGTAKIARQWLIPAIQKSHNAICMGIASRNLDQAEQTAKEFGILKAYGDYQQLCADPEIDAVYIPLPNHLHDVWALKALELGKHVLCEKPIAKNQQHAETLFLKAQTYPKLLLLEAFMYHYHPQWKVVKNWISNNLIGQIKHIEACFTYCNTDPHNIRRKYSLAEGGGGLLDVGCYCTSVCRWLLEKEPLSVLAHAKIEPQSQIDDSCSFILDFGEQTASCTCAINTYAQQAVRISGTRGRIEVEQPFKTAAEKTQTLKLWVDDQLTTHKVGPSDSYQNMVEAFGKKIKGEPVDLLSPQNSLNNFKIFTAILGSIQSNKVCTLNLTKNSGWPTPP